MIILLYTVAHHAIDVHRATDAQAAIDAWASIRSVDRPSDGFCKQFSTDRRWIESGSRRLLLPRP